MSEQDPVTLSTDQPSPLDFSRGQGSDGVFAMSPEEWDTVVEEVKSARLGVVTPAYLQSIRFGTDSPLRLGETQAKAVLEEMQAQGIVSKEERRGVGFAVLPETAQQPVKPGRLRALGRAALKAVPGEVRKQTKEYTAVRTRTVANGTQATARGAVRSAKFVSGSMYREKKHNTKERTAEQKEADQRWSSGRQTRLILAEDAHLVTEPVLNTEEREQERRAALEAAREGRMRREEIRGRDLELKEREQELRTRELEQRERALQLRDEALARGEILDISVHDTRGNRATGQDNAARQDYLKRKARWDEQTAIIDKYQQQAEFVDLFDEDKLRNLDAAIQADVAPKYAAALRSRIAELDENLPDDQKWKPVDAMTPQEKEVATKKVLTGKERGDIANPVDDDHTRQYLGDKAGDRELALAISWQRRRLMERSSQPQPPQKPEKKK